MIINLIIFSNYSKILRFYLLWGDTVIDYLVD